MPEDRETRKKRLAMRSMRRGTKEMDILLIRYSDARLATMSDPELDAYEALLEENDQDLYQWISGQVPAPKPLVPLIESIREVASGAG
ncbi:succinate dehydrogenase assembly factor 2 [Primorskyibacter sp. 2E107]|uniref:FAD assembly factor SdhE n=1 Tax=Primorskyibacter sp. 2E107 TaxID=3403458 RepID=UPI003AF4C372